MCLVEFTLRLFDGHTNSRNVNSTQIRWDQFWQCFL